MTPSVRSCPILPLPLALLLLLVAAGAGRPDGLSAEAASRDISSAHPAAVQQGASGLEVDMAGPWVRWTTVPGTSVAGELSRDGEVLATARGAADEEGMVTLAFFGDAGPVGIQGGDEIEIEVGEGEVALRWTVPTLEADVDASADRILGRAPAEAMLTAALWRADGMPGAGTALTRTIRADAGGAVEFELGDEGIEPGDAGRLTLEDEQGNRYHAAFTALRLEIRPGNRFVMASATLGTTVSLALESSAALSTTQSIGAGFPGQGSPATRRSLSLVDGDFEAHVFGAGDRLRFSREGGLLPPMNHEIEVPELAIELMTRDGQVRGKGPISASLRLLLQGPLGEAVEASVRTDADGLFDTTLDTELGPGWRARLLWDEGIFRVVGFGAVPQVQVFVHTASLRGVNTPRAPVSATLRSEGEVVGTWTTQAEPDGSWFLQLGEPSEGPEAAPPRRVRPGDVLEIDLAGGDPVTLVVPPMSARSDPDAETVSGEAPAGARLQLSVEGGLESTEGFGPALPLPSTEGPVAVLDVTAGPDGRYVARIDQATDPEGAALDLEPPMFGSLVITRDDGHQFRLRWAPLSAQIQIDGAFLFGIGPGGRQVRAELRAPDGTVVGAHPEDLPLFDPGSDAPTWFAILQDELGQPVSVRAGDRIDVQVGDDTLSLTVPALEGVIHVKDDLVTGRGLPGADLLLRTFSLLGERHERRTTIPEDGAFRFDLGTDEVDIQYNWTIEAQMDIGRHSVLRGIRAPGLTLNLDTGAVFGSAEAGTEVILRLERAGRTVLRETFRTTEAGLFSLELRDGRGEPLLPRPGDELVLEVPEATSTDREVRMTVPELTVEPRLGERTVGGRTAPDGRLEVYATTVYPVADPSLAAGRIDVAIAPDGRWTGEVANPEFVTRAGTGFYASLQLASGHQVYRSHTVPVLNVQYGGAAVCGYAPPYADVQLRAPGGATARGRSEGSGQFALTMADPAGNPRPNGPGETVRGDLGGTEVSLTLPEGAVTVAVDWETWVVTGTGPAGAPLTLSLPGRRCQPADDPIGGFFGPTINAEVGPDGNFRAEVPSWFRDFLGEENRGVEVAFFSEEGHRYFVYQLPLRAQAHVGTPRVVGAASPGQPVALRLLDGGGTPLGSADVVASPFGTFDVSLADPSGDPVLIEGGHILLLSQGGHEARLDILPLAFDFSESGGLAGTTAPGQAVEIAFDLRPSPERFRQRVLVERTADEKGRFEVVTLPPRSDWRFEDVRRIRLSIELEGGHELLSELVLEAPLDPEDGRRLFLPLGWR